VIDLKADAIRILEQQRVVSRRPSVLARRAHNRCALGHQEGMQFVDIGALAGAEAEMMQCSNVAPACSGDGALMPIAVRPPTQ
jgi:hypothetical protein